jgi:dTDP-4-dehydrorhamnose reductase
LAERILTLCRRLAHSDHGLPPILHMAGSPPVSRADWVESAFTLLAESGNEPPHLRRVPMATFGSTVTRPNFSALDSSGTDALFGSPLDWRAGLADCVRAGVYRDLGGS